MKILQFIAKACPPAHTNVPVDVLSPLILVELLKNNDLRNLPKYVYIQEERDKNKILLWFSNGNLIITSKFEGLQEVLGEPKPNKEKKLITK